ncbi:MULTISPECIES: hypothetical protein [unclassified Shewanella]|uniref:hypothetical protein n=1 Tax=unclassified Shewanella TaxID=196818 RepID=UPI001BBE16BD|nr:MULTISPECIES: hypothetical protein [unclassified Shewanella]GIU05046.1 hypothetical protein TUM4444_00780 [Shewanella sp. MBTL60-112-B1]GIU24458.1 hypothetical protein TUM4445_01590 [Shewanella sp. MBTL60-112-B2]
MLNEHSHHCGEALYLCDKYCPRCGDTLEEARQLKGVLELHPKILDELKQSCPESTLFTGVLKSTYHYQRSSKGGLKYSYWWVILEAADGSTKQISLNAENSEFNDLKPGELLTILEPTQIQLQHELVANVSKNTVRNNDYAAAVIRHKDVGQRWTREKDYNTQNPGWAGPIAVSVFVAILLALVSGLMGLTGEAALFLGTFVGVVMAAPLHSKGQKQFQLESTRLEKINATLKELVEISKEQLGYHRLIRPNAQDDTFCHHCESRLHSHAYHCFHCGLSQQVQQENSVTLNGKDVESTDVEISKTETFAESASEMASEQQNCTSSKVHPLEAIKQTTPCKSAAQMRQAKLAEFSCNHQDTLVFSHVLGRNQQIESNAWCYMVQVVDREVTTQVTEKVDVYTVRTSSRLDVVSTYETHYDRSRDSRLESTIQVENNQGERFEQCLPESMLSSTDVGDYLLVGYSRLFGKKRNHTYAEYYYNISKGEWLMPESVVDYGKTCLCAKFLVALLLGITITAAYYSSQYLICASVFGAIMLTVLGLSLRNERRNLKAANQLIKPIMDTLYRVRDSKQQLLTFLLKLS